MKLSRVAASTADPHEIDVLDAPIATPLPAAWTMMLIGMLGIGISKLRRTPATPPMVQAEA